MQTKGTKGHDRHFSIGDPLSTKDIKDEVGKVNPKKLKLGQFIVATTAASDGDIQRWVEKYTEERWIKDRHTFRV